MTLINVKVYRIFLPIVLEIPKETSRKPLAEGNE